MIWAGGFSVLQIVIIEEAAVYSLGKKVGGGSHKIGIIRVCDKAQFNKDGGHICAAKDVKSGSLDNTAVAKSGKVGHLIEYVLRKLPCRG